MSSAVISSSCGGGGSSRRSSTFRGKKASLPSHCTSSFSGGLNGCPPNLDGGLSPSLLPIASTESSSGLSLPVAQTRHSFGSWAGLQLEHDLAGERRHDRWQQGILVRREGLTPAPPPRRSGLRSQPFDVLRVGNLGHLRPHSFQLARPLWRSLLAGRWSGGWLRHFGAGRYPFRRS